MKDITELLPESGILSDAPAEKTLGDFRFLDEIALELGTNGDLRTEWRNGKGKISGLDVTHGLFPKSIAESSIYSSSNSIVPGWRENNLTLVIANGELKATVNSLKGGRNTDDAWPVLFYNNLYTGLNPALRYDVVVDLDIPIGATAYVETNSQSLNKARDANNRVELTQGRNSFSLKPDFQAQLFIIFEGVSVGDVITIRDFWVGPEGMDRGSLVEFNPDDGEVAIARNLQVELINDIPTVNYLSGKMAEGVYFRVGGDADTYYPVLVEGFMATYGFERYSIGRAYSWEAPDTWYNNTHKGALTLTYEATGDTTWGGGDKAYRVTEFHEAYSNMVAGMQLSVVGMVVWLRGGGALYRVTGPAGQRQRYRVYEDGFETPFPDNSTFLPRTDRTQLDGEIYSRYPIRRNGNEGNIYENNERVYSPHNRPTPDDIGALAKVHDDNTAYKLGALRGVHGGYGDTTGATTDWGANIWSMGPDLQGSIAGHTYGVDSNHFGLAWLRADHTNASHAEGLYQYSGGALKNAFTTQGVYTAGDYHVNTGKKTLFGSAGENKTELYRDSNGDFNLSGLANSKIYFRQQSILRSEVRFTFDVSNGHAGWDRLNLVDRLNTPIVETDTITAKSKQGVAISAGESKSYTELDMDQELIYLNAESGVQINSSPDNWASGWASRKTVTLCDVNGRSWFEDLIAQETFRAMDNLQADRGVNGGYGGEYSNGESANWGSNIWSLGHANQGGASGGNYALSNNQYGMAWLRPSHSGALFGEGLYVYRAGGLIGAMSYSGLFTSSDMYVNKESSLYLGTDRKAGFLRTTQDNVIVTGLQGKRIDFDARQTNGSTVNRFSFDLSDGSLDLAKLNAPAVYVDDISNLNGNYLTINAGESLGRASGQTSKSVYINSEEGVQINSSPDNWATGWAARHTVTLCDVNGRSFLNDLTAEDTNITGLLQPDAGVNGGYGGTTGSGTDWGANIWSMGPVYSGTESGPGYDLSNNHYGLAWLRGLNPNTDPRIGEGLHIYRGSELVGGIGHTGLYAKNGYFAGDLQMGPGSGIRWDKDTDGAGMRFNATGDSGDNHLQFYTADNGDEWFRWSAYAGSTVHELMSLRKNNGLVVSSDIDTGGNYYEQGELLKDRYIERDGAYIKSMEGALRITGGINDLGVNADGAYLDVECRANSGDTTGLRVKMDGEGGTANTTGGDWLIDCWSNVDGPATTVADRKFAVDGEGIMHLNGAFVWNGVRYNDFSAIRAAYAVNAGHADSASNAAHAVNADNATNATNAAHAVNADNATNATNAAHAVNADQADNATNAAHAVNADQADNATNADQADNAANAGLLDNLDSTQFLRSDANDNMHGRLGTVYGMHGGYGDFAGSGTDWASTIWAMGSTYGGADAGGSSWSQPTYALTWQRSASPGYSSVAGEGLYLYSQGGLKTAIGHTGMYVTGQIYATNNITAYYSDGRLKTKVEDLDPKKAYDAVVKATKMFYHANALATELDSSYDPSKLELGVDAAEFLEDFGVLTPLAPCDTADGKTSRTGENYLTFDYQRYTVLLSGAIEHIDGELKAERTRNEELEKRIEALEELIKTKLGE